MKITLKKIRNVPHPLLGKICQYKEEFEGREVVTDYPKELKWQEFGYKAPTANTHCVEYIRASTWVSKTQGDLQSLQWAMPKKLNAEMRQAIISQPDVFIELDFNKINEPLYPKVGACLEKYLQQEPWTPTHPWGHIYDSSTVLAYAVLPQPLAADQESSPKLTVTPLYHLVLERCVGNSNAFVNRCSVFKCSVFNPAMPDITPKFYWLREEWLEEHTQKETYDEDAKKRFRETAMSVIAKTRAGLRKAR